MPNKTLPWILVGLVASLAFTVGYFYPKKHEYFISFNDRDSAWSYHLKVNAEAREDVMKNCPLSERVNTLSLEVDGKWVAYRGFCGEVLELKEVDH